jgi:signal-transduction protein with cAMP-binding, CBS, and nucleotidyltransferase domain
LELRKIYNYLRTVNFFKDLEKEKLEMLAPQITAKEYNESELCKSELSLKPIVMKQDDDGDFMLIIYEGRAIVTVDGNKVAEKNTNDVVGETALQTKTKRKATVTGMTKCRCLVISKNDYDGAVDLFKTLQKHKTNEILKQLRHL